MDTHVFSVMLSVEVEAFSEADAREAVRDCFGEGDFCGVEVSDFEILDHEELT